MDLNSTATFAEPELPIFKLPHFFLCWHSRVLLVSATPNLQALEKETQASTVPWMLGDVKQSRTKDAMAWCDLSHICMGKPVNNKSAWQDHAKPITVFFFALATSHYKLGFKSLCKGLMSKLPCGRAALAASSSTCLPVHIRVEPTPSARKLIHTLSTMQSHSESFDQVTV